MLFIVAVTLGLLAVMGVYGLTATASDVRAAGEMRQALQTQRAAESGFMMTAETLNPTVASTLVQNMSHTQGSGTNCLSAATYTGNMVTRDAEACLTLTPDRMKTIASQINGGASAWTNVAGAQPGFSLTSFGNVNTQPYLVMELTNPIDIPVPKYSKSQHFTQVTVTVYSKSLTAAGTAPLSMVKGRGRLTVGPTGAGGPLVAAF